MLKVLKRLAIAIAVTFTALVFALFAINFYRNWTGAPGAPGIIFERQDRPSYS